jgi:hypothetical protein
MLVQEYLKTHSLEQLKEEHAVNYRIHGHKFSLNYDMIEARDENPICCECRGLVLCPENATASLVIEPTKIVGSTKILARGMNRFFNFGQGAAADVNFEAKTTKFFNKLDGSYTALHFDYALGEWCVSTRSVPEADLPIDGFGNLTFRKLFEKAVCETTLNESFSDWLKAAKPKIGYTYILELCTPANRVVVEHKDFKVYLIAIRNNLTGQEYDINSPEGRLEGIPLCESYSLGSLKEMLDFVANRSPSEYEGIVAMDYQFNRVKVKNAGYLALSRIKESAIRSPRALLELCLLERLDDALPLLPAHLVAEAGLVKERLGSFINNSNKLYSECLETAKNNSPDKKDERECRKQMALAIQATAGAWMPYMMALYLRRVSSFEEFMNSHKSDRGEYNDSILDTLMRLIS